ncbi:MAG TPA: nuclear transport factor 2 family protein [Candidatus Limnocylindria bacterium]|nr:nuclear transport factor 2 family protein [Candidatus Limnocylindria bacterium]
MKTLLPPLACALLVVGCRHLPPSPDAHIGTDIRAVLDQQQADWNAGNIAAFMQGYAKSQSTRFASGDDVTRGWQTVYDRYVARYGDRAAMGRLSFSELEITPLSPTAVEVFGHWRLEREKDSPHGVFTLLFRKTARGWRIIHDHTSSATP